jgi:hypothetical protein
MNILSRLQAAQLGNPWQEKGVSPFHSSHIQPSIQRTPGTSFSEGKESEDEDDHSPLSSS